MKHLIITLLIATVTGCSTPPKQEGPIADIAALEDPNVIIPTIERHCEKSFDNSVARGKALPKMRDWAVEDCVSTKAGLLRDAMSTEEWMKLKWAFEEQGRKAPRPPIRGGGSTQPQPDIVIQHVY